MSIRNQDSSFVFDISYDVSTDRRFNLTEDLITVVEVISDELGSHIYAHNILKLMPQLTASLASIGTANPDMIRYRARAIDKHLRSVITVFNFIWLNRKEFVHISHFEHARKMIHRFSSKMNKLTAQPLTVTQRALVSSSSASAYVTFHLSKLNEIQLNLVIKNGKVSPYSPFNQDSEQVTKGESSIIVDDEADVEAEEIRIWLESLSSDVLNAYNKTEDILSEVTPLLDNAEDEYFVEQINAEYYPHIFAALRNFHQETTEFTNKEVAVTEAVKQFTIIQLGLQKIIDGTVKRHMNAMRLQTDFLRNKVLGDRSLALSSAEADELVEKSVEEAQQVRDDLYKKHVAPILAKNKKSLDEGLTAAQNRVNKMQLTMNTLEQAYDTRTQEYEQSEQARQELANQLSRVEKEAYDQRASAAKDYELYQRVTAQNKMLEIALNSSQELQKDFEDKDKTSMKTIKTLHAEIAHLNQQISKLANGSPDSASPDCLYFKTAEDYETYQDINSELHHVEQDIDVCSHSLEDMYERIELLYTVISFYDNPTNSSYPDENAIEIEKLHEKCDQNQTKLTKLKLQRQELQAQLNEILLKSKYLQGIFENKGSATKVAKPSDEILIRTDRDYSKSTFYNEEDFLDSLPW